MGVAFRGGVPAEGAAELAGGEGEDLVLFLQPIHTSGIDFHFPGAGVVMAIGADGFGDVVMVELADACGEVAV
jgi:hypothetical protein